VNPIVSRIVRKPKELLRAVTKDARHTVWAMECGNEEEIINRRNPMPRDTYFVLDALTGLV